MFKHLLKFLARKPPKMALNFLTILSGMSLDFETVSEPNRLTEMNICYLSTFLKVKAELNSVHLLLIASTLG